MMRRISLIATAAAVLIAAAPQAQAIGLGGGLGGGVVGGLGGGLGGVSGGLQGSVSGSLDRTVETPRLPRHPVKPVLPRVERVVTGTTSTVVDAAPRIIERVETLVPNDVTVRERALIAEGVVVVPSGEVDGYMDNQVTTLRQDLRGSGVQVRREGERIILLMPADVTFAFDKYSIQPRFYRVLDSVARTINHYPSTLVDITGHTDAIGSASYNQRLSERRAEAVADFLAQRRTLADRFHVEGMGKTEPVASNATIQGRAANRRVEIVLTPLARD